MNDADRRLEDMTAAELRDEVRATRRALATLLYLRHGSYVRLNRTELASLRGELDVTSLDGGYVLRVVDKP